MAASNTTTLSGISVGRTFTRITDVEDIIQSLQKEHHPLKVFKCDTVEAYNKKVINACYYFIFIVVVVLG